VELHRRYDVHGALVSGTKFKIVKSWVSDRPVPVRAAWPSWLRKKTATQRQRRVDDTRAWRARQKRGAAVSGRGRWYDFRSAGAFWRAWGWQGGCGVATCSIRVARGRDVLLLATPRLSLLPNSVFQIHETAMAAGAARRRQYFRRRSTAAWRRASRRLVARAACTDGQPSSAPISCAHL